MFEWGLKTWTPKRIDVVCNLLNVNCHAPYGIDQKRVFLIKTSYLNQKAFRLF